MLSTFAVQGVACDLKDIGLADAGCGEAFSGLGNKVYVFFPEDLQAAPTFDEKGAAFAEAAFTFAEGKGANVIKIKKQSGHLSSTGNAGAKGWNVTLEFVIDKDLDNAAHILRILKNRGDAVWMVECPDGTGYYVVYDPVFGTEVNSNFDSGTTPDSDNGHTVTVTCNPCRYSTIKWSGTLTLKSSVGAGG